MDKDTFREGYGKVLGRLEQEILESLWKREEATGKEVHSDIKNCRQIALTTVLTVLERLTKKGFVRKSKGLSVFLFSPIYSKEEFARAVSSEILKGVFEISSTGACASFVDIVAEDPGELERLSAMIEKKKAELSGRG